MTVHPAPAPIDELRLGTLIVAGAPAVSSLPLEHTDVVAQVCGPLASVSVAGVSLSAAPRGGDRRLRIAHRPARDPRRDAGARGGAPDLRRGARRRQTGRARRAAPPEPVLGGTGQCAARREHHRDGALPGAPALRRRRLPVHLPDGHHAKVSCRPGRGAQRRRADRRRRRPDRQSRSQPGGRRGRADGRPAQPAACCRGGPPGRAPLQRAPAWRHHPKQGFRLAIQRGRGHSPRHGLDRAERGRRHRAGDRAPATSER